MYSHPHAIDAQRRLFGRPRRSFAFWFWSAYFVFSALAIVAGAFFWRGDAMQPWNQVQVRNEDNPHNGRAGVVTQVNRENGQAVVKLDATSELPSVDVAVDVSELRML